MSVVTQKFLLDVNDRTKIVSIESYKKTAENLQWDKFARIRDLSGTQTEKIVVPIEDESLDLDVSESYLGESTSYTFSLTPSVSFASRKKTILRSAYTDGPLGAEMMASFGRQMGVAFARAPEDLVIAAIKANPVTEYDGLTIWNTAHLIHAKKPSLGTFSNIVAAVKIDESVATDVALKNLGTAIAKVMQVPTASGKVSMRNAPKWLIVPPALRQRAFQLCSADFLAGSNGSSDVRAIVGANALTPVVMNELGAAFGGSDTTYYLACEFGEVGQFIIGQKEQFELVLFSPQSDSHADEQQEYTSRARGRIGIAPAMPHYVFQCNAT